MTAGGSRRGAGALLLAVVVAAGTAACGVPTDERPRPFRLERPLGATTTTSTVAEGTGRDDLAIYLVADDRLVRVERPVTDDVSLDQRINALLAGPSDQEKARNWSSAIPAGTALHTGLQLEEGTLTIDLTDQINQIEGEGQELAYAQIVLTAVAHPAVDLVRFEVGGEEVTVPTDDGNISVVGRENYRSLVPTG